MQRLIHKTPLNYETAYETAISKDSDEIYEGPSLLEEPKQSVEQDDYTIMPNTTVCRHLVSQDTCNFTHICNKEYFHMRGSHLNVSIL